MDDPQSQHYDSLYEMDAPHLVDFDATELSVNESIFDRKVVGERSFRVFKDIVNLSSVSTNPLVLSANNSPLGKRTPKTPANQSKLVGEISRRVTRSSATPQRLAAVEIPSIDTPKQEPLADSPSPAAVKCENSPMGSEEQQLITDACREGNGSSNEATDEEETAKLQTYPKPVKYDFSNVSGCPVKQKNATATKVSRRSNPVVIKERSSEAATDLKGKVLRARSSSVGRRQQHANLATPFIGKRSPLKTLRARTRSKDNSLHARSNSASGSLASKNKSPTKSSARHIALSTRLAMPKRRSASQSSVGSGSQPTVKQMSVTGISPALSRPSTRKNFSTINRSWEQFQAYINSEIIGSRKCFKLTDLLAKHREICRENGDPEEHRLMRPTESAKLKTQSPSKRKTNSSTESKPSKTLRSTQPKSPTFHSRSHTRVGSVKSSEDLVLEQMEEEKKQLRCLKKMNEAGLKQLVIASGGTKKRPIGLPSGKMHAMATRSDELVKAKKSIYDALTESQRNQPSSRLQSFNEPVRASPHKQVYPSQPRITKARSPKLQTRLRERQTTVPSAAERELMELQKIKQAQFKATPVDKTMLTRHTGVKKLDRLPPTVPLSIKFATDTRLASHAEKQQEAIPKQPIIKAQSAPKPTDIFKPKLEHKKTNPAPFTFERKDEASRQRRAELIQKVEEDERQLREFKATPLPPSPTPLPPKQVLPPTLPDPFQLKIDVRGQMQQEKFQRKVREETSRMLEATKVHAKPADVLKKAPFVPKKEAPKFTEPFNVELSSTRRAGERKEYELRKLEEEEKLKKLEEEQQRRKEREERREMIILREATIVKPAPIRQYKPVQIKQSDKPLTKARSPRFSKK